MIYYSTGGFRSGSALDASNLLVANGIRNIELSGGRHDPYQLEALTKLTDRCRFIVHNYFPPPATPFVLNLASLNSEVAERSVAHVKEAIQLAQKLGSKYYSLHAGFLLDPKPKELGTPLSKQTIFPRERAKNLFLERLRSLAPIARNLGIRLLIENNVLSKSNFERFGENVLLAVDADETSQIMDALGDDVGLLIDLAHLKVSARTLDFDPIEFLQKCANSVEAYHFSDNGGLEDTNEAFDSNAWFKGYIKPGLDYYSIEVYDYDIDAVKRQIKVLEEIL